MKSAGKVIILIMFFSIAGSTLINAQRGDRGMRGMRIDTLNRRGDRGMRGMWTDTLKRPGDRMMKMEHMRMRHDSLSPDMMRNHMQQMMRMHDEMWFGPMYRIHRGYGMRPGYAWGPGFRKGDNFGYGRNNHQGWLQEIPNLTDKQKKDIADLRQKQQADMKKLREETQSKMTEMRDSFHNKVKDMLTDEQKEYFEGNQKTESTGRK